MTLIYDTPVLEHVNDPSAVPLNNFVDQLSHAAYPGGILYMAEISAFVDG